MVSDAWWHLSAYFWGLSCFQKNSVVGSDNSLLVYLASFYRPRVVASCAGLKRCFQVNLDAFTLLACTATLLGWVVGLQVLVSNDNITWLNLDSFIFLACTGSLLGCVVVQFSGYYVTCY
jgi:hypothetical protein